MDLGVTERQIQKLERSLFEAGAITWNDSGNHKRYGQRHPRSGRLIYAYGIELTPLADLADSLENKLHEKALNDAAWMETKRQISWYRSQILAMLREDRGNEKQNVQLAGFQKRYDSISIQIRTHIDLSTLRTLWDRHKSLYSEIRSFLESDTTKKEEGTQRASMPKETHVCSSKGERKFTHYKSTTQKPFNKLNTGSPAGNCFQESVVEPPRANQLPDTGIQHVRIGLAVSASSVRFREHLPENPNWHDLVEAASVIRQDLGISQKSWEASP